MSPVATVLDEEQKEREEKRKKEALDKKKGEEMRKAAMELLGSKWKNQCFNKITIGVYRERKEKEEHRWTE